MEANISQAIWKERYKSIKKKLKELQNLRKDSVNADIKDLREKIEEHKRVHQITIKNIQNENAILKQQIDKIEEAKDSIQDLESSISNLKTEIKRYDPNLRIILDFPRLKIVSINNREGFSKIDRQMLYTIACGPNDIWVFDIYKNNDKIVYHPNSVPNVKNLNLNSFYQKIETPESSFRAMLKTIDDILKEMEPSKTF